MIGLIIPPGEIKKLLEKTAQHVALNGSQFEKILIERQQHKAQFCFLRAEHPFRAYYDHKVAENSKKLLQGITPAEEMKVQAEVEVVKKEEVPQQQAFLSQIFVELKEPDPQKYIAVLPQKLPQAQQAIIQHTAQYAAKNGKNFLVALSQRQKNNPQFQFLRAASKNHQYFIKMVQAYTNILDMDTQQLERLLLMARNKQEIFKKCKISFDYYSAKQQQARGKKDQQAKKVKESNVDWNDFELVDTISFDTDHNKNLASSDLLAKIQQHAPSVPKSMQEKIIFEPKKRQILQQCHVCRRNILASEMNKHLKTCLAQKKKGNGQEMQDGQDVDIGSNLQSMSLRRPDIFGLQENKISLDQGGQENRIMFDGQAANLNRSSGAIVMRQFEQKRNKEELAKKQQK